MFYPRFAKLSGSSDPAIVRALDRLLAHVWRDGYRTIGHTYVARELAIGDEVAADLLLEAADLGIVAAKFDLRCPHCGHVVAVSSIRDVPVADHECPNCWQTFTPSQDDLFISFEVLSPPEGEVGRKKAERGGTCPPPSAEAVSFDTLVETSSYFRQHFAPGVFFHLPSADKYQSLLERCFTEWEATSKGEALEDLARYLLDAVNVFRFKKRDHDAFSERCHRRRQKTREQVS